MKGVCMFSRDSWRSTVPIDRDILFLPELEITDLNVTDPDELLRPLFDMLWNAAGLANCPCYDQRGKFDAT
jgi:hypothetical protein